MTPEGKVKASIKDYLNKLKADGVLYWWSFQAVGAYNKNGDFYRSSIPGVSDIVGVINNGPFFAIEVKAGKNTTSAAQELFLFNIERLGHIAIVARSVEDVKKVLLEYETNPNG